VQRSLLPPSGAERTVVVSSVTGPALILGSAQPETLADREACERLGARVVRRHSGGGAVFVAPGAQVWVDCFLPAGDDLLESDVGRSFSWLGEVWAAALAAALDRDTGPLEVHSPVTGRGRPATLVCFGEIGSGEVTLAGRKVVGLSQRRTRAGAWFHCLVPLRRTDAELVECLQVGAPERARALGQLGRAADVVEVPAARLEAAFLAALA
jgi:lipoate-protein ligase A